MSIMDVLITKKVLEVEAFVPSETHEGMFYRVEVSDGDFHCTCPDYKNRGTFCKHIKKLKEELKLSTSGK